MNTQNIPEEILSALAKLPPELAAKIYSDELLGVIRALGERHGLRIDQVGELEGVINLRLAGVIEDADFRKSVAEAVGNEKSAQILTEIDEQIFKTAKDELIETANAPKTELETVQKVPEPARSIVEVKLANPSNEPATETKKQISPVQSEEPPAYKGVDPYREPV